VTVARVELSVAVVLAASVIACSAVAGADDDDDLEELIPGDADDVDEPQPEAASATAPTLAIASPAARYARAGPGRMPGRSGALNGNIAATLAGRGSGSCLPRQPCTVGKPDRLAKE